MEKVLIDEAISSFHLDVNPGENARVKLAAFSTFPNVGITVNVHENATFEGAFADFSGNGGTFVLRVNLLGKGAKATWKSASICAGAKKVFDTNIIHQEGDTEGLMENYGIVSKNGKLHFKGTSAIEKGAKGAATRQNAKIIIFDPGCDGRADPILKIDENDVKASHGAVVGKLNDEHIFYLCSRGLSPEQAKRLITLGYIRPIEVYFDGELRDRIETAIEEGL